MHACRSLSILALAGILVGSLGCHSEPPPPPLYPPWVEIDDPTLYGKIAVSGGPRLEGNLLFVQCQVTNVMQMPSEIECMFHWFDDHGVELNDPNARWAPYQFGPNETKPINKSGVDGARSFKVVFRWSSTIH